MRAYDPEDHIEDDGMAKEEEQVPASQALEFQQDKVEPQLSTIISNTKSSTDQDSADTRTSRRKQKEVDEQTASTCQSILEADPGLITSTAPTND